jgi:hypothetical protein
MRKDMSKVIVERPRRDYGRGRPGRSSALEGADGEPLRARARLGRARKTKYLNENLAPLRRYLESQVGRPWSKVYSEISEHLRPTSTVQQHVRDHIEDFVSVKTRMESGNVFVVARFGGMTPLATSRQRLYVHPRTGLLLRNKYWAGRRERLERTKKAVEDGRKARMRELEPGVQLHLLKDGAWWEVRLAPVKTRLRWQALQNGRRVQVWGCEAFLDVVLRAGLSDLPASELYGRTDVYAVAKRQLNRNEKKRLGLPPGAQ